MKIGLWSSDLSLFDYKSSRDNYSYRWFELYCRFKEVGVELVLFSDISQIDSDDFYAIIENGVQDFTYKKKYLLIVESKGVRPQDWNSNIHIDYRKIFCWDDDLVDDKKYFKLNYAFKIPATIPKKFHHKKLCCIIAGNKSSKYSNNNELYSERVKFIRWFEKNHPEEFDLYGTNWDQYRYGHNFFGKVLNKIKFLRKNDQFLSYKGMVESKFETMKNYQFSICYENIKDQNGYITEKIFDSFFAGCVPIYWGAKNITDHIPSECFIDKRNFSSLDEIYSYIKNMSESNYMKYLDSIENFLGSSQADPFRAEVFAETIVREVMKDINESV